MTVCIREEVVCHKSNADGLTIDDSSCNLCSGAHLRMKDWIFCWNGAGISGIRPVLGDANSVALVQYLESMAALLWLPVCIVWLRI